MQKQKINYLTLQSSYDHVEMALFENLQKTAFSQLSKFTASSGLIPLIESTLAQQNLALENLDFICASLGPAPFTTLRTTIVTLNGISFVTKVPLVGVNGIETFAQHALPECQNLVVILNAFNKSVYFGIRTKNYFNISSANQEPVRSNQKPVRGEALEPCTLDHHVTYGWQPIDLFLNNLQTNFGSQPVTMIGQGLTAYVQELQDLPANFVLDLKYQPFPDIGLIAQQGLKLYLNQQTSTALTPLYLKQAEPFK
jgi:tRNA threonylcarbamoyl adenosine modification protein YeaZ